MKIYFVPISPNNQKHRISIIPQQGLKNLDVDICENPEEADFILMTATSNMQEIFNPKKLIFVDLWDDKTYFSNIKCLCYFKRSWANSIQKTWKSAWATTHYYEKIPISFPDYFYPTSFAIMDQFLNDRKFYKEIDVGCFFRKNEKGNRGIITKMVDNIENWKKHTGLVSPDGKEGRGNYNQIYFDYLKKSKIVVTCQPSNHDGDSRTWEAFSSGALVAVDKIIAPIDYPLKDREHAIIYDTTPEGFQYLHDSIHYFLDNPKKLEEVARNGYEYTMKYHRSANRIDSMLKIAQKLSLNC